MANESEQVQGWARTAQDAAAQATPDEEPHFQRRVRSWPIGGLLLAILLAVAVLLSFAALTAWLYPDLFSD